MINKLFSRFKSFFLAIFRLSFFIWIWKKLRQLIEYTVSFFHRSIQGLLRLVTRNKELTLDLKVAKVILIIVLVVITSALWHGLGNYWDNSDARARQMRPVSVVSANVISGQLVITQTALGTVTPRNTITVYPQVSGILSKVFFKEGDLVKKGQLMALVDPRPFEAAVKQAEGALQKDRALLNNAEIDLKRYDTLLKLDSISQQTYATQKALVDQYKGNVLTDIGAVNASNLQLEFAHIKSPISGRVGLRSIDPGNLVQPNVGNGLFVITQLQPTTILFSVPQDAIESFKKFIQANAGVLTTAASAKSDLASDSHRSHQTKKDASGKAKLPASVDETVATNTNQMLIPVEAWSSDNKVKLATGYLDSVDNQVDLTTGTVKLRGVFSNDDLALFPNQFVNIRIVLDTLSNTTLVPIAAIQRGVKGTFVYSLGANDTVSVAPVKLGASDGVNAQVLEGLEPGNVVIVEGTDKLRHGAKVIARQGSAPEGRLDRGAREQNKVQQAK